MPACAPSRIGLLAAALALALPPGVASADVPPPPVDAAADSRPPEAPTAAAVRSFDAAWFADAAPADAADMVRRLPGFTIVDGDEDIRGYAGAQGNVLIDGVRPASKRDDITTLLERIPAAGVERIELIRGGAGIDMAGHALLANVVRRPDPAPELAVEAGVSVADDGGAEPLATVEYSREDAGRELAFAYERDAGPEEEAGDGTLVERDADGAERGRALTDDRSVAVEEAATFAWRQPWLAGRLDIDAALRRDAVEFDGRTFEATGDADDERVGEDETIRQAELAVRWERTSGANRLALLASAQRGEEKAAERSFDDDGSERFDEDTRTGETLASIVFGRAFDDDLALTTGLELADNRLEGRSRLRENGETVELPGSRVDVDEDRAEASVALEWRPRESLQLDAGLRVEHSRLRQQGDAPASRRFTYVKPRVGIAWQVDETQRWRASLARDVGQLDFGDFVADASLADEEVSAGNADLEPDKTWRAELEWERRLGADGALVLTAFHERVDDVVDRIPVLGADGELFDAPGNIGRGTRDGLALELGVGLDRLGLRGARLSADVLWQRSRVDDPTTGESRRISGDKPLEGSVGLEQVLHDGATTWGVEVTLAEEETEYSFDEVDTETEGASWRLYGERHFGDGWRVRAELADIGGQRIGRVRDDYDGVRGDAPLDEREVRSHRTPGVFMLTLRREFGG